MEASPVGDALGDHLVHQELELKRHHVTLTRAREKFQRSYTHVAETKSWNFQHRSANLHYVDRVADDDTRSGGAGPEDSWPDEALVVGAREGNREAFGALYRRYAPDVHRFARGMCGSATVADDVVQDVFVAMLHDLSRFDSKRASVLAYLFGVARNEVRRRARRIWRREVLVDEVPQVAHESDPLGSPARAERCQAVRVALAALPIKYREVLVMCDMQGLDYASVAATLAAPIGTIRSRLHRGRLMLSDRLARAESSPRAGRWAWRVQW